MTNLVVWSKTTALNVRCFSTSSCMCGNKMRKMFDERFPITGKHVNERKKAGSKIMAERLAMHVVQPTGYVDPRNYLFRNKKEMIPEIIVPDLSDFRLKPYVAYNAPKVKQEKIMPEDFFDEFYTDKVTAEYNQAKLKASMDLEELQNVELLKKES